jgi:large subunit ribosomal protein L27
MAHVKAGGTSKNNHDSPGQRLGVKLYANQKVKTGQTIVRQIGLTKRPGSGTSLARDYTIYASKDGVVHYQKRKVRLFTGKTVWRTEVTVE